MDTPLFSALFSFTGVFYGLIAPLILLLILVLMFIASMQQNGAQPKAVMQAIFCHLVQAVGVLLMTGGSLPTVMSVLAGRPFAGSTYFALLILFTAGGLLFLWQDDYIAKLDDASKAVCSAIFVTLYKIIGHLTVIIWTLSFVLTLITGLPDSGDWWISPIVMVLYGGMFIWCTREQAPEAPALFQTMAVHKTAAARSEAKKPLSIKKSGRK